MPSFRPFLASSCLALLVSGIAARDGIAAPEPNTLTETEKAAGWQLMFDGKSMAGWHSFRKTTITDNGWLIKDSSVYLRGPLPNGPAIGGLLAPNAFAFRNFEISIDWKVQDDGNSGIFLRYLETEASENIRTGPESQVCGKLHFDYKDGIGNTSPGACYGMYPPAKPWIKSQDEYNTFHVVMYEDRVAHFGNGIRLLEYVIGSDDWKARYEVSKYANFPLYGDIHAGKLFLQDHANHVWYRNLKIRPLTEDPWASPGFVWPDQAEGIRPRRAAGKSGALLSVERLEGGVLRLRFDRETDWDLGLMDFRGRRVAGFRGEGSVAPTLRPDRNLGSGRYFLSGRVGGLPVIRALPVSGSAR